ncbi:MAG: hypothetical protein QXV32_03095 [Conexivisphaerales archaeon]
MKPPAEPDLSGFWSRNVWLYGLRVPFSLMFLSWITFSQALSPYFSLERYILLLAASFFGLVVGAHYIDIATSRVKFAPYFRIPYRGLLFVGVSSVLVGVLLGIYIAVNWDLPYLLAFVAVEGFAAIAYPREKPKVAHSYPSFGITWGSLPVLASYYVQADSVSVLALGVAVFAGIMVVVMHHLSIMTRESPDWKNCLLLFNLYKYSIYTLGLFSLVALLFRP